MTPVHRSWLRRSALGLVGIAIPLMASAQANAIDFEGSAFDFARTGPSPPPAVDHETPLRVLSGEAWDELIPNANFYLGPSVYEPIGRRLVTFRSDPRLPTLFLGNVPGWHWLEVSGAPPPNAWDGAYDPVGHRMIVYAGPTIWALTLDGTPTWTQLATTGPAPSSGFGSSLIYDEAGHRVILYGGL